MSANLNDVHNFFEYVKSKGIAPGNTVTSWQSAVSAIALILSDEEKSIDFILQNRSVLLNRLQNSAHSITGSTAEVYMRRCCKALEHFKAWKQDRAKWER